MQKLYALNTKTANSKVKIPIRPSQLLAIAVGSHRRMKKVLLNLILLWVTSATYGQSDLIDQISADVKAIDSNSELTIDEFDPTKVYGNAFDGGGEIEIYQLDGQIQKIHEQIGLSFGRITTIIYLENSEPILIIDREENFKRKDDGSFDYSTLNQLFEAQIYVSNGKPIKTDQEGSRVMTDKSTGIDKYLQKIEMAEGLLKK